jgi:hypothetical protein
MPKEILHEDDEGRYQLDTKKDVRHCVGLRVLKQNWLHECGLKLKMMFHMKEHFPLIFVYHRTEFVNKVYCNSESNKK